ncbi:hypothetical protein [Methanoculleus sp. MH98A]|uniref:hypothetical protein n=1 Tax=Methanoculleus sp. MH98A TaxID=1495314 RepID=UPI000B12B481|nr:hypothetical protein [Methanoculleus sp. MH98A]
MRAVCIHGHFYQPPRENPWLGEVGVQRSAAPYHDWNERVTAECYAPNTAARILDDDGMIEELVNNYARISFTAAPTLFAWLEWHRPRIYGAILDADRESRERYGGHGSAIACCYNHVIMPLAARRDKRAQVTWGVRDFTARFGRMPEGMWLSETAVDIESLEILAAAGIRFTILAPHQAAGVRALGEEGWKDVSGGQVDTKMPYLCRLPSGGRHRGLLLRRGNRPRRRVRRPALRRAAVCRAIDGRVLPGERPPGTRAYRDGWGNLRPPPRVRGDGARLLPPGYRGAPRHPHHGLRRVPRRSPAHTRGAYPRRDVVELRSRYRAMAGGVRVP